MTTRSKYRTKQREILIEYFKEAHGGHVTAADVYDYFAKSGSPIGQATVYRQLESLVDEGVVNKYIIDGNSPACFEYVGSESHCENDVCFHCKCEQCGKLIHMHCEDLEGIEEHLYSHHQFKLNPLRTVFYGICEDCLAAESR
ncbi:MAG: transcriptional repressor [Firmicutes bacterium]|nr:transcriptional repressor [Bacillota bacterium]